MVTGLREDACAANAVTVGIALAVFCRGVGPMTTDASLPFRMSTSTPVA